jgi:hypothetical protein
MEEPYTSIALTVCFSTAILGDFLQGAVSGVSGCCRSTLLRLVSPGHHVVVAGASGEDADDQEAAWVHV